MTTPSSARMIANGTAVPASRQATSGFDVVGRLDPTLRHGAPLVERGVASRGGYQAINVAKVKRFQSHVPALQYQTCFHPSVCNEFRRDRNGTCDLKNAA